MQVNLVCEYLDELNTEDSADIKDALSQIKWAAKVLSLDQPGDIRRYNIQMSKSQRPFKKLDETLVRAIMARRVDFSKDVVSKVKIVIT
jgi:hypothetical protein